MALAAGTVFAGYRIQRVLGAGGMGTVYLAQHPRLPRRDALKLLSAELSLDPEFQARFEREADLAAGLDHANIVSVHDRGREDAQFWIAMQYVEGSDAAEALRAAPGGMPAPRVVRIVSEVSAALDFAHRGGLLHRDVKPANILLAPDSDPAEPERVLLTDFGVAKAMDDAVHLTSTGSVLATLAYAAPEQIEGRGLDRRVDVYALGCVLHELLTGSVPYPASSPYATMSAHLTQDPPKITAARPELPARLDDVLARAMAKTPDERYGTCRELARDVAAVLTAPPRRADPTIVRPRAATDPVRPTPAEPAGRSAAPRAPVTVLVRRTGDSPPRTATCGPLRTTDLRPDAAAEVHRLLERSRFAELAPRLNPGRDQPGDVLSSVRVTGGGLDRAVMWNHSRGGAPAELLELVRLVERHAPWQVRQADARPAPPPPVRPVPRPAARSRTPWLVGGAAAAVVLLVGAVLAVVLTRGGDAPPAPALAAPTGLTAVADGLAVTLGWQAVPGATTYVIARDGQEIQTQQGVFYRDADVSPGARTYTVLAQADGQRSAPSAPATATASTPWGDVADIVAAFSSLLPATPEDVGYAGATCSERTPTSSEADGLVFCEGTDGLTFEVVRYPDAAAQAAQEQVVRALVPAPTAVTWTRTDVGDAGTRLQVDAPASSSWVFTTFTEPALALFTIYVEWPAHTVQQILDTWWQPAPF